LNKPGRAKPHSWRDEHADGIGLMACAGQHTGYARFCHAGCDHPRHPAVINVADCQGAWHRAGRR
jgi:hypothetical protein